MSRIGALALLLPLSLAMGAKKEPPTVRGESESIELIATPVLDLQDIKQLVGSDLDGHYTLMKVRIASRFGKEIEVRRDDFLLRTDKDGEKSRPFAPSQIAGRGALIITESGVRGGGGMMGDSNGPVWGGTPGTSDRPRRMGGDGGAIGNTAGGGSESRATMRQDKDRNPLEQVLKDKILPEQKTTESLSGLLYFPLEKQKLKDLELIYAAPDGKISIRFKQ